MTPRQFTLEVAGLPVQVTRKAVKNMYLRVDAQTGAARITAPASLTLEQIMAFAQKHGEWLAGRARQIKEREQPAPEVIPDVQKIWGEAYPVALQYCLEYCDIRLEAGKLLLSAPEKLEFGQWSAILDIFLRDLVRAEAPGLIGAWSKKLELPVPSLGIRRMKRRWGTCYPTKKRIILNSAIAAYPKPCLEAVIVHELLHFREPNHGPAFKALLDQALPDWRQRDELLR